MVKLIGVNNDITVTAVDVVFIQVTIQLKGHSAMLYTCFEFFINKVLDLKRLVPYLSEYANNLTNSYRTHIHWNTSVSGNKMPYVKDYLKFIIQMFWLF